jgi:hypothetical protein
MANETENSPGKNVKHSNFCNKADGTRKRKYRHQDHIVKVQAFLILHQGYIPKKSHTH